MANHRNRIAAIALLVGAACPADAAVQIVHLGDMAFGTAADGARLSESVCAYTGLLGGTYSVTGTGSGSGGAFTLASGSATLDYQVQWAASSGQTSGTLLTAGTALANQPAALLDCSLGASNNASLIVVLPTIGAATAGTYSGTLQIMLAPN